MRDVAYALQFKGFCNANDESALSARRDAAIDSSTSSEHFHGGSTTAWEPVVYEIDTDFP